MFFLNISLKNRLLVINLLIKNNGQKNKNRKQPYSSNIILLNVIFLFYIKMAFFFASYKMHKNEVIYNQMKQKPNICLQEKNIF